MASMALAAYLVSSAERRSINITRSLERVTPFGPMIEVIDAGPEREADRLDRDERAEPLVDPRSAASSPAEPAHHPGGVVAPVDEAARAAAG